MSCIHPNPEVRKGFRRFFKNGLFAAGVSTAALAQNSNGAPALNVLFIVVDDLRTQLGCYGNEQMKTPNIDRLAGQGVVFNRAYCQFALCNASRASVLTGMYSERTGVQDNVVNFRKTAPDGTVSLPQYFRTNGYFTVGMGKVFHTHGKNDEPQSWSRWVDMEGRSYFLPESLAVIKKRQQELADREKNGEKFTDHQKGALTLGPSTEEADVPDAEYPDGMLADMAVKELQACSTNSQPFFLAVGFLKPHLPLIVPKKYWDLYDPEKLPVPENLSFPQGAPSYAVHNSFELRIFSDVPDNGPIPDKIRQRVTHGYYAACSFIDAQVGKVMDELKRLNLDRNTIVIFWGDNGFHLGDVGMFCKDTNYEEATHVPLIISAPQKEYAGEIHKSGALVEFVDIFPTLCDLTGLAVPSQCDGKSLTPLLRHPEQQWGKAVFTMNRRNWQHPNAGYAMRTDRYRYVRWMDPAGNAIAEELYDYEKDPNETLNRINSPEDADVVKALRKQFNEESPLLKGRSSEPVLNAMFPVPDNAVFDISKPAVSFSADFSRDRLDGWLKSLPVMNASLNNGMLEVFCPEGKNTVYYPTQAVANGQSRFSVEADFEAVRPQAWGGVAFNYQSPDDFYVVRICSGTTQSQFVHYRNGNPLPLERAESAVPFEPGKMYRIKVCGVGDGSSKAGGLYKFEVCDTVTGQVLVSRIKRDSSLTAFNGAAGCYLGLPSAGPLLKYSRFAFSAGE